MLFPCRPWCLLSPHRCRAQEPAGGSVAMAAAPRGHLSTYSLPPLPHSPCNGPLMFEPLHLLFLSSPVPQALPRPLVGGSESDKCPGLAESLRNGRSGSGNWIGPLRGSPHDKMDPSSLGVNHSPDSWKRPGTWDQAAMVLYLSTRKELVARVLQDPLNLAVPSTPLCKHSTNVRAVSQGRDEKGRMPGTTSGSLPRAL